MKVYLDIADIPSPPPQSVVVMGTFDGVHLGHRALFELGARRATAVGSELWALTFDPHPSTVLGPELAPPMLCTLTRRLELISELCVDAALVVHFDHALARTTSDEFVERYLLACGAKEIVVGYDFTFGRGRGGDTETLSELGMRHGFEVLVVPPVSIDGGLVPRSTKVRELLLGGKVEAAATLLGRPHDVHGRVITGEGRGRTIGFPTANVEVEGSVLLPSNGVYAGWVHLQGESAPWAGALNIGTNPTFSAGSTIHLEIHLLDYAGPSLVGRGLRVDFVRRLRGERRFESVDALVEQIEADVEETRATLGEPKSG